jgi:hypothetical protein
MAFAMALNLASTLRLLRASDIRAGVQTDYDGALIVWLADARDGVLDAAYFRAEDAQQAPGWLAQRAIVHYPRSSFARCARYMRDTQYYIARDGACIRALANYPHPS